MQLQRVAKGIGRAIPLPVRCRGEIKPIPYDLLLNSVTYLRFRANTIQEWIKLGGQFTFSDDSHGIAQVGTNYARALDYLTSLGVSSVFTLERDPHPGTSGDQKSKLTNKEVTIASIKEVVSKW